MSNFKELIGRKILALHGDTGTLEFLTDKGGLSYGCDGDCCSISWFEHVSGIDVLVGHTVQTAETIAIPEIPREEQKEEDIAYGYQLVTDKGHFLIEMRNSSNGYYGGYITGPAEIEAATRPKLDKDF